MIKNKRFECRVNDSFGIKLDKVMELLPGIRSKAAAIEMMLDIGLNMLMKKKITKMQRTGADPAEWTPRKAGRRATDKISPSDESPPHPNHE